MVKHLSSMTESPSSKLICRNSLLTTCSLSEMDPKNSSETNVTSSLDQIPIRLLKVLLDLYVRYSIKELRTSHFSSVASMITLVHATGIVVSTK